MIPRFDLAPDVRDWQWAIARAMRAAIEKQFASNPDEIACVQAIVSAIKREPGVAGTLQGDRFSLEADSVFLHGGKSQVRFEIGGREYQRELADLLVLATYVEDGALGFQRVCFIQAKRSAARSARALRRFPIEPWQLALLDGFPEFTGVSGVCAGETHQLRNRSGMLGAYGLLSPPGQFAVVSARVLDQILCGRASITSKDVAPVILSEHGAALRCAARQLPHAWHFDPWSCPECRDLARHGLPGPWLARHHRHHGPYSDTGWFGDSVLSCLGPDEFVRSWSSLQLGELWTPQTRTGSDLALRRCLVGLVSRVVRETGELERTWQALSRLDDRDRPPQGDYSLRDGAGLGIMSVVASVNRE